MAIKKNIPAKKKKTRLTAVRPNLDGVSEKMIKKLAVHYDRSYSDVVRRLIKADYIRLFGEVRP